MEFKALDENFDLICKLEPINIQWNRYYYKCGGFVISIPFFQYSSNIKYIFTADRKELGLIQKVDYEEKYSGDRIILSGFFLEKILDDKIIFPRFIGKGNIEEIGRTLIERYKEDLQIQLGTLKGLGTNIELQETGEELGKKLYKIYETQEMSYYLNFDYAEKKIYFETYRGKDRTQDQEVNNWVTFSKNFLNVTNVKYIDDKSNYKNYIVVAGGGEGTARIFETLDMSENKYKQKIFVDARDLQQAEDETLEDYKKSLRQRGLEKLTEYQIIQKLDFNIISQNIEYLKDFDLGDKVDILIDDLKVSYTARITEIKEVIKENNHTIELGIGNKIPTVYDKLLKR